MWSCSCGDTVDDLINHLRLLHPDVTIERWPDGAVVYDDHDDPWSNAQTVS